MTIAGAPLSFEELAAGVRLFRELPPLLRHPIGAEEARAVLGRRLERREADFLALARSAIYAHPASPYLRLLQLVGCEQGDLEQLVAREGLEAALSALFARGVYLTIDEFKGQRPAVRGSASIRVEPSGLRNPASEGALPLRSSGSRGSGTPVLFDLASIRDRAVNTRLMFDARGSNWLHANWSVPGGFAIPRTLRLSACGLPPVRWFSQIDPGSPGLHPRFRWSARAVRWAALLAGVWLPSPEHVALDDPLPIARWMASVLRDGHVPHLWTFPSSAARLCQVAGEAGVDLRGAQFSVAGEPLTAARLAVIHRAGAEALPDYGNSEAGGFISYGCLARKHPDEVHLFHDLVGLIQPGAGGGDGRLPPLSLLLTSLRPTTPLVLLNVSPGDQAVLEQRTCGCPLERLGWTTHLHSICSFEKLTAAGMTFLDVDVVRVLEEVLPARFGGGPTDYQLVEEETAEGEPRLVLLVRPSIGPLEETAVVDAFLAGIGAGSVAKKMMELHWRQTGLLRVQRSAPYAQATGKILHLHQERRAAPDLSPGSSVAAE